MSGSVQAVLQQTLSTQKVVAHWLPIVHAPCGTGVPVAVGVAVTVAVAVAVLIPSRSDGNSTPLF